MVSTLYRSILPFAAFVATATCVAQVSFKVALPASAAEAASGRLIVAAIGSDTKLPSRTRPVDWPFWDEAQPAFGIDVTGLKPGESVTVNDTCTFYPVMPSQLAPGKYRVQARLVTNRTRSDWDNCPGSLYSAPVEFEIPAVGNKPRTVELSLTNSPRISPAVNTGRAEFVAIKSPSLSKFYGHDVELIAGVVLPVDYDPKKTYPTVYNVPGFGGDHRGALHYASSSTAAAPGSPEGRLARSAFQVFLDAESPNGHTLFVDSANNGPRGSSLVNELVLEIEKRYPLARTPAARVLRGHSSGGWSTLWLALEYPDVFGATWSSSPDSVDFRRFQIVDIYSDKNMYFASNPADPRFQSIASLMPVNPSESLRELCSYRKRERKKGEAIPTAIPTMSIRRENLQENVIGPRNDSGQQWDSWFAAFGPRGEDGNPVALFDVQTGEINPAVAASYRKFDIADRIRTNPKKYAAVFVQHARIVVGDLDNFFLNEAVALLKKDIDALPYADAFYPEGRNGYIKIVPNHDHSSIFSTPEIRGIPEEMMAHFAKNNLVKAPATPPDNGGK